MRLLLIGRGLIFRQAMRVLLEQASGITVVGESDNTEEALVLVSKLRPDVVLCGAVPPDVDPCVLARRMAEELQATIPVVVITNYRDPGFIAEVLRSPVAGYVHANINLDTLIHIIEVARAGLTVLAPDAKNMVMRGLTASTNTDWDSLADSGLTLRELEVLRIMVEGATNKAIAERLGIRLRTVEMHVAHIVSKLKAGSRTEVVIRVLRQTSAG
ncbi:MAG: response regulator transcription factor [Chloroflexi bacterium]|nr:response regulator transcription factor [Chloroflexota bacterium]